MLEARLLEILEELLVLDRDPLAGLDVEFGEEVDGQAREHDVGVVERRAVLLVDAVEQLRDAVLRAHDCARRERQEVSVERRKGEGG